MQNMFARLLNIFKNPREYFADPEVSILDGALVIFLLFVFTFIQKLVWVDPTNAAILPLEALRQAAVNSLLVWSLFCVVFYALDEIFHTGVKFLHLAGMVGSAGAPLVVTTLLSALMCGIAVLFNLKPVISQWTLVQEILGWLGLALSWPGLFGFFLMRDGLKLPKLWAFILTGLALAFFIAGEVIPLF